MTNDTFEIIAGVFFFVLIAITVASLLPLDIRKKGWKWIWPFLPVVYGIIFLTYETATRHALPLDSVPIRVDMLVTLPMGALVCIAWVWRGITFLHIMCAKDKNESADHTE